MTFPGGSEGIESDNLHPKRIDETIDGLESQFVVQNVLSRYDIDVEHMGQLLPVFVALKTRWDGATDEERMNIELDIDELLRSEAIDTETRKGLTAFVEYVEKS